MNHASITTRKLAGLGAVLGCTALLTAGCGSEDQQAANGAGPNGQIQLSKPTVVAPGGDEAKPAKPRPTAPVHIKPKSFPVAPLAKVEERALQNLERLRDAQAREETMNARQHAQAVITAVRDLTEAVILSAGLEFATFDVIDGGKAVNINVPDKDACLLSTADATRMSDRIVDASDIVDHVTLRLTSGGSLRTYLKKHCRTTAHTAGLGPVLLDQSDSGMFETAPFRAQRSGWTIDWTSYSGVLQIYIYKNHKLVSTAVNQSGRGSGQKKVLAAGTYTLQVAGTGAWKVKVRDGVPPRLPTVAPKAAPTTEP